MHKFSIKAYAKVNLVLDVLRKTGSGYHEIQTILHEVPSMYDVIDFEKDRGLCAQKTGSMVVVESKSRLMFASSNPLLIFDDSNTIVKAVRLFEEKFHVTVRGLISVEKNIPVKSGLGGGSSDAAAMLKLLVCAYGIKCCENVGEATLHATGLVDSCHSQRCPLFEIATQIGMDVPFFINGGTQLATHFGEKLMPLMSAAMYLECTVINKGIEVSTREAYNSLNLLECGKNIDKTRDFLLALANGDAQKMLETLHNDFESCSKFDENGARIMLAGSGGCYVKIAI